MDSDSGLLRVKKMRMGIDSGTLMGKLRDLVRRLVTGRGWVMGSDLEIKRLILWISPMKQKRPLLH